MAYGAILGQTPQVATTVTEGNNKPVTSNAVYEAIQPLMPVDMVASGNEFPVTSNAVFEAISAIPEGVKIATGSYIATGTYGISNPNSLTFEFEPDLVILMPTISLDSNYRLATIGILVPYSNSYIGSGWASVPGDGSTNDKLYAIVMVRREGNRIDWYSNSAATQLNFTGWGTNEGQAGYVRYIAFGK